MIPDFFRRLPGGCTFILPCVLVLTSWSPLAAAKPLPNIVVFIADDHSMVDSAAYGSTEVRTPNMAALAADGMKFTHAFIASPSCGPSRTALLTGLWPARNGAEPNHKPKNPGIASLPPALHALGYETAAIGKVSHNLFSKDHGFDFVDGETKGLSETAPVARFLTQRDASKPLCLFVGTRHPHTPWSETPAYPADAVRIPPAHVDTSVTRSERAAYLTDITKADTLLGEVRSLAREKIPGDTLFIYTADHGSAWPFGKWSLYDYGIRIPFIISWPGHLKPGSTSDAMICWPDLLPTFIELAGGTVPVGLDGKSFAGVLWGNTTTHRERVFTTHSGDGDFNVYPIRSVRTRDWKYLLNPHPEFQQHTHISRSTGPSGYVYWKTWLEAAALNPAAAAVVKRYTERPAEELYDLAADPSELKNLADDPAQATRLTAMRQELRAWMKEQGDQETVFGTPLPVGQPVTMITPGKAGGKALARQEQEWTTLFNGTNLDGWERHSGLAEFSVEDGAIVGRTVNGTINSFLCTKQEYTDFILEFEFKVGSMNSGVQFRSQCFPTEIEFTTNGKTKKLPPDRVHGYQFEIDPSPRAWTGGLYDEGRRGWLNDLKENEPARNAFKKGEWNAGRIECRGDHLQTWINGTKAADLKDGLTPSGIIALQVHRINDNQKPGQEIRWRNLRLKSLSSPAKKP